jgi:hypothetical protein
MAETGWNKLFEDPISSPGGRQLVTLHPAAQGNPKPSLAGSNRGVADGGRWPWAVATRARRDVEGPEPAR